MLSIMDKVPPENAQSRKALEMARGNPDLIQYVKTKIENVGKQFKCEEEIQTVVNAVNDTLAMADFVKNITNPLFGKCWDGTITSQEIEMLKPGYFNYQDLLAQKKLQEIDEMIISEKMKNVVMVYDVNEKSEFVRAYISNGKQLETNNSDDQKIIDLYDQCFHSWLVFNNMSSQEGVIFSTSKLDKQGKYTEKANPENIVNLINDPERGLDASLKKQNQSLSLQVERFSQQPEIDIGARADKNV